MYAFIPQWTPELLLLVGIANNATTNVDAQSLFESPDFNCVGYILRSGIVEANGNSIFTIWRKPILSSTADAPFYITSSWQSHVLLTCYHKSSPSPLAVKLLVFLDSPTQTGKTTVLDNRAG